MMKRSSAVGKNMMLKLKESFSQKSFSSTSYHTSLICNSKTIRMDVNLINGDDSASSKAYFVSNFTAGSSGNASKKNQELSRSHDKNLEISEVKNKSVETSIVLSNHPTSKKIQDLPNAENSIKSPKEDGKMDEDGKSKLKLLVRHSYKVESHGSVNQTQTKAKETRSDFKSFQCDVCMKYFSSQRNVKRHSVLHSSERHPCETCGKVFKTKENLKRHCRAVHEVKVKSIKCSICYKAFSRKADLNIHLRKHPHHVEQDSLTVSSTSTDLLSDEIY